jgi:aspartyl-tRNA(Asn)/glutamyl-tRNA(Gln) amidotransferase subunit A
MSAWSADDLSFSPLYVLAERLAKKELSPVELTRHYLDRIDRLDGRFNAYMEVCAQRAQAAAQAAETAIAGGHRVGPLHGIPLAVKDLIDVAGLPTTGGSRLLHRVADRDATVWRRLAEAGAVLLGKTNMVEFAFGGAGINHHYGTPYNPWDAKIQRLPGGSSSGSGVAVAAGLAPAALGSDTGGSVRIPASFCALVGLKPTFGRVSNHGVLPLDPTLDTIGPMVRCVRDAQLLFSILAGSDPADAATWGQPVFDGAGPDTVKGMRLGLPRQFFWDEVDPQVEAAVRQAAQVFADMGAHVEEVSLPELDTLVQLRQRGSLTAVESYAYFREWLDTRPDEFDPIISVRMLAGKDMTAVDFLALQRAFEDLRRRFHRRMAGFDALLTPTTPFTALPVAQADTDDYSRINGLCLRNTSAANQLGLCALSLPCGFDEAALPIGLQLICRPFEENTALCLGQAYEDATSWHQRRPALEDFAP